MDSFKENGNFNIDNILRIFLNLNILFGCSYINNTWYLSYNSNKQRGKNQLEELLKKYLYKDIIKYKELYNMLGNHINIRIVHSGDYHCAIADVIDVFYKISSRLIFIKNSEVTKLVKSFNSYSTENILNKISYILNKEINQCDFFINNINLFGPTEMVTLNSICNHIEQENKFRNSQEMLKIITNYKNSIESVKQGIGSVSEIFNRQINFEELFNCFNYDELCLMLAISMLTHCTNVYLEKNYVNNNEFNSLMYSIKYYIECVDIYRKKYPGYNPSVIIDKEKKREKRYFYEDLKNNFESILEAIPDYKINPFNDIKFDEELPWEIISPGHRIEILDEERNISKKTTTKEKEEKKLRVIEGYNYLISIKPIRIFKGKDKFYGYMGFEFSNDIVVFEKIYNEDKSIAVENATYIMNKNNFKELCKLNKSQILWLLKKSKRGIRRLYHTKDMKGWKNRIKQFVQGNDYTIEAYDYIDELISLSNVQLKKDNKKRVK